MNLQKIEKALGKSRQVTNYIAYLNKLSTQKDKSGGLKNKWAAYIKDGDAIRLYEKVAATGVYIDGEAVTLQFKGELIVSYNYQAYKNMLISVYPETLFDLQNVYEGDDFSFRKESGKVIYEHKIGNPFEKERKWIGCYCIIKNNRGEFLETLNATEVAKMRNVAMTKNIWNEWFEEMTLKSVIKRACKRHFRDIVVEAEKLDNENYDLEKGGEKEVIVVGSNLFEKLRKKLAEGIDIDTMREHYDISDEVYKNMVKLNK